ncbi:MAG: methionine ABC transporter permease [Clostridium sp.]
MDNMSRIINEIMIPALGQTMYMVVFATIYASIIGIFLATILVVTAEDGLRPNRYIYKSLDVVTNILRSFPFVILAIAILPFTRAVVGTTIGMQAAILPLVMVESPFVARVIEVDLRKVNRGMIEAAKSFGASDMQIIFKVIFKEAIPSICLSITLVTVSIVGSSAMAGALGAGGLGSVAIIYGYQSFNDFVMYGTVFILVIMVQGIQSIGSVIYKRLK